MIKNAPPDTSLDSPSDEQGQEAQSLLRAAARAAGKNDNLTMSIKVYSPYKVYFDDISYSISAVNASGPFDILPRHHNFITLLSPCELLVRSVVRGDVKVRISGGLMHVKSNQIIVFLDV